MNAPAITKPAAPAVPAVAPAKPPSAREKVTTVLAQQRDRLETVFRQLEGLSVKVINGTWPRHNVPDWLCQWVPRYGERLSGEWHCAVRPGSHDMAAASAWLEEAPSLESLEALKGAIREALDAPVNAKALAMSVGMLLDAYPQGRETRDVYYATLVHDIEDEGYGPHVLAEACRRLRRTQRFAPAVAETLEACREARGDLERGLATVDHLLVAVKGARAAREALAVLPAEWPADWWSVAVQDFRRDRRCWSDRLGPPPGEDGCKVPVGVLKQWGMA